MFETRPPPKEETYWYDAECNSVVDGDTVDLCIDLGFRLAHGIRVRLWGINTYELNSSVESERKLAQDAKAHVMSAVEGNHNLMVKTYMNKHEKYGRWLAEIWYWRPDQINEPGYWSCLNKELLDMGLATQYMV